MKAMPMFRRLLTPVAALVLASTLLAAPAAAQQGGAAADKEEGEEEPVREGIEIGRFMIRDLRVAEGTNIRVSFTLYTEVPEEEADATRQFMKGWVNRIRNEVIVAIRTCEQRDFQEPGLETFRRRIYLRLQRTVPKLPVERLLVGEFEFFND